MSIDRHGQPSSLSFTDIKNSLRAHGQSLSHETTSVRAQVSMVDHYGTLAVVRDQPLFSTHIPGYWTNAIGVNERA